MILFIATIIAIIFVTIVYLQHPKFGKAPRGTRLERIKKSPHFKDGIFQNLSSTPYVTEGYSMASVAYDFIFTKFPRTKPKDSIPSIKTNLKTLPITENILVWFGHSSYYIQLEGKKFLVDPVFSGNASPVPTSNKSFKGTDIYTADDMPEIDYLLISHDHYDHLDYETIIQLKPKIKNVICGLGVGSHLEHWNLDTAIIQEKDWNESISIANDFTLHTATARHFSGRSFTRNNTLWLSFILQTPNYKMYLGGDSGYDTHFIDIGKKFGGFDLAILENGQYNKAWHEIHMLPDEVLKAAKDLNAKRLLPVHSGKFKLAFHPWDEPLNQLSEFHETIPLVTPIIGEVVYLENQQQKFEQWWMGLE